MEELSTTIYTSVKEFNNPIVEYAPIGIYTVNQKGCIDFFNPKFLEINGAPREKLLGLNVFNLSSYKANGLITYVQEVLAHGKKFEIEIFHTSSFTKKETYRHYIGVPLRGKDGVIHHALLLVEDITERKRLQIELEERTKKLEELVVERNQELKKSLTIVSSLIQEHGTGILVEDEAGLITVVNKNFCDVFSITMAPSRLVGVRYIDLLSQMRLLLKEPQLFLDHTNDLRRNRRTVLNDEVLLRDGSIYERNYIPVYGENNQFIGHLWQYNDVTAARTMQETLKQRVREFERINKYMIGREIKMAELKKEIQGLAAELSSRRV